jgi:chemotaxis protein MotB
MTASSDDESGIAVYPRLPVPAARKGEARQATKHVGPRRRRGWPWLLALGMAAGGAAVWFGKPLIVPEPRIATAEARATEADAAAATQKARADALEKSLDATARAKRDAEAKLTDASAAQTELAGKTAAATSQRKAAEQVQARLRAAVDKAWATIAIDGEAVHLQIADRMLWKPNDDALTDRGKAVLGKLAAVLKDLPDRLIRVQGHTDDQPIALAKPPAPPPPAPPGPARKGARPAAVAPAPPPPRFATNWELSSARALAVVHFLQDSAKLDPARLSAQAFGQYAPVSNKDKAANRRLELVVIARPPPGK